MAEIELPDPEELQEIREKVFTRRVALVTAFFAVMLAITSLGGSNAMKDMLLAQQQSSDQWAFYQAKVIREHLYRSERIQLEMDLVAAGESMSAEARKQLDATIRKLGEEEERYRVEKRDIETEARRLEGERDVNKAKDPYFDYSEVLLQIAIVMASISILAGSGRVFAFAVVAAALGAVLAVNGFLLLFRLPFLHG